MWERVRADQEVRRILALWADKAKSVGEDESEGEGEDEESWELSFDSWTKRSLGTIASGADRS